MRVQQLLELGGVVETGVLFLGRERGEVGSERRDAVAVRLLPAAHRPVELALGDPLRALDARAPRKLLETRQQLQALLAKMDGNDKLTEKLQEIIGNTDMLKRIGSEVGTGETGKEGGNG